MRLFRSWESFPAGLQAAARTAVIESLAVRPGERVLLVTNPARDVSMISRALYDAVVDAGAAPVLLHQAVKSQLDFADPEVRACLSSEPSVFISMSFEKLGKDRAGIQNPYEADGRHYDSLFHYLLFGRKILRAVWSPGANVDMFTRTVPVDYARMKADCARLAALLSQAASVRITNPNGTELEIGLAGRTAMVDDGDFSKAGTGGNLPAGEAFISPALGASNGRLVYDGSISSHRGDIVIRTPISAEVRDGCIVELSGAGEADELRETIRLGEERALEFEKLGRLKPGQGGIYAANARCLGELGLGLNPAARVTGNMLEDEKAFRTCHVAIGSNYDADQPALIHLDGIVSRPSITAVMADGSKAPLMLDGELCGPS